MERLLSDLLKATRTAARLARLLRVLARRVGLVPDRVAYINGCVTNLDLAHVMQQALVLQGVYEICFLSLLLGRNAQDEDAGQGPGKDAEAEGPKNGQADINDGRSPTAGLEDA